MRILVCGGRNYSDSPKVHGTLHRLRPDEIIIGGANGADALAVEYAQLNKVDYRVYYPQWRKYGNAAGPLRNQRMLDDSRPDLVVAFPGGVGTADMMARAEKAGVPVQVVTA